MKPSSGHPSPSAVARSKPALHQFRLYVFDSAPVSARAIANTRRFCDEHFPGAYDLQIIDIKKHPAEAVSAQIVAVPTLIRSGPASPRRYIGDLSRVADDFLQEDSRS
jgi:circadian clock protein KaiB